MRYKATVMYDGPMFHGFQIQEELRTSRIKKYEQIFQKTLCKKEKVCYNK